MFKSSRPDHLQKEQSPSSAAVLFLNPGYQPELGREDFHRGFLLTLQTDLRAGKCLIGATPVVSSSEISGHKLSKTGFSRQVRKEREFSESDLCLLRIKIEFLEGSFSPNYVIDNFFPAKPAKNVTNGIFDVVFRVFRGKLLLMSNLGSIFVLPPSKLAQTIKIKGRCAIRVEICPRHSRKCDLLSEPSSFWSEVRDSPNQGE